MSVDCTAGRTQQIILLRRQMHITEARQLFSHGRFALQCTNPAVLLVAITIMLQQIHEATAFRKTRHTAVDGGFKLLQQRFVIR